MKVYELIQYLAEYNADTEVEFHVKAEFDADVEATFDRENEDDVQDVTVEAEFDEDVTFDDISNMENNTYHPNITINLEY